MSRMGKAKGKGKGRGTSRRNAVSPDSGNAAKHLQSQKARGGSLKHLQYIQGTRVLPHMRCLVATHTYGHLTGVSSVWQKTRQSFETRRLKTLPHSSRRRMPTS